VVFSEHYHAERNHQGLANELILPGDEVGMTAGKIECRERLGGMLKYPRISNGQCPAIQARMDFSVGTAVYSLRLSRYFPDGTCPDHTSGRLNDDVRRWCVIPLFGVAFVHLNRFLVPRNITKRVWERTVPALDQSAEPTAVQAGVTGSSPIPRKGMSSAGEFVVREYGRLIWCPRFDKFREQNRAKSVCGRRSGCGND